MKHFFFSPKALRPIDLTLPLSKKLPPFPGDPPAKITAWKTYAKNGWNETHIVCSVHTGTHMDAPLHFTAHGKSVDQIPLAWCIGKALCINVKGHTTITPDLLPKGRLPKTVLLYTGWTENLRRPKYFETYPLCTMSFVKTLIAKGVRTIGIDAPSIERFPYHCHTTLLQRDRLILENLANLKKVVGKTFILMTFPLAIAGADGSPIRAVALLP